jgi:ribosomal protein L16/L10AE
MKNRNETYKTFKKSSKFIKLKTNLGNTPRLVSKKNYRVTENQINAIKQKLIRSFKFNKVNTLLNLNKNLTAKSLGSKLGSGKGKIKGKISLVKKFQPILIFASYKKIDFAHTALSKFINLTYFYKC